MGVNSETYRAIHAGNRLRDCRSVERGTCRLNFDVSLAPRSSDPPDKDLALRKDPEHIDFGDANREIQMISMTEVRICVHHPGMQKKREMTTRQNLNPRRCPSVFF